MRLLLRECYRFLFPPVFQNLALLSRTAAQIDISVATPEPESEPLGHPDLAMQCSTCMRVLCHINNLTFFGSVNEESVKVHLMLKPERYDEKLSMPPTFCVADTAETKAEKQYKYVCGAMFGNTRPLGRRNAFAVAFKAAAVVLCDQRLSGANSKWPTVYNKPLFDAIEVRIHPLQRFRLLAS